MLGLTLRDEFQDKRFTGMAIEISNDSNTGATQTAAQQFLKITYPAHSLLKAGGPDQSRPVIAIGERDLGNSLNFARDWQGKGKPTSDLDQALVLIGACVDGNGINAPDTRKNDNFKQHMALKPLLKWLYGNSPDQTTHNAALRVVSIFTTWQTSQAPKPQQASLLADDEEYVQ